MTYPEESYYKSEQFRRMCKLDMMVILGLFVAFGFLLLLSYLL